MPIHTCLSEPQSQSQSQSQSESFLARPTQRQLHHHIEQLNSQDIDAVKTKKNKSPLCELVVQILSLPLSAIFVEFVFVAFAGKGSKRT